VHLAYDPVRVGGELRGGVDLGRVGDVNQMMRDAAAFLERQLVGADVETAIHGGRIAVDDLATVPLGEGEPEGAFPRGGGAKHGKDQRPLGQRTRIMT
jgi:hypothetical protein